MYSKSIWKYIHVHKAIMWDSRERPWIIIRPINSVDRVIKFVVIDLGNHTFWLEIEAISFITFIKDIALYQSVRTTGYKYLVIDFIVLRRPYPMRVIDYRVYWLLQIPCIPVLDWAIHATSANGKSVRNKFNRQYTVIVSVIKSWNFFIWL